MIQIKRKTFKLDDRATKHTIIGCIQRYLLNIEYEYLLDCLLDREKLRSD